MIPIRQTKGKDKYTLGLYVPSKNLTIKQQKESSITDTIKKTHKTTKTISNKITQDYVLKSNKNTNINKYV